MHVSVGDHTRARVTIYHSIYYDINFYIVVEQKKSATILISVYLIICSLSAYGNIFILCIFYFMLHALKNRLAVHIEKSEIISCFDIKYFALCKSAVLKILLNNISSDKYFTSVVRTQ